MKNIRRIKRDKKEDEKEKRMKIVKQKQIYKRNKKDL